MAAWKYIKGSEKDFLGAPDWATMLVKFRDVNNLTSVFLEREEIDAKFQLKGSSASLPIEHIPTDSLIIAQRERVTSINDDRLAQDVAAVKTLEMSGYTYHGGELWKPPLGKAPKYITDDNVNTLITERGSRYGKFKDGAEIMRDLKHTMHNVDGWDNLTPSQKEALDMIQHKIGRILNGDPAYDDSWKDIAGYAMLIVEELNGVSK